MGLLSELNLTHQCDKNDPSHTYRGMSYLDIYERHFAALRFQVKEVLELGVLYGNSLRLWRDYFPNAHITGLDCNPLCKSYEEPRISIVTGDQADPEVIAAATQHGPFDLIIDDASHLHPLTIASWDLLWPHVIPGGWYAIEDLGFCNAWENNPRDVIENWFTRIFAEMDRPRSDIRRLDRWFYLALFQKI